MNIPPCGKSAFCVHSISFKDQFLHLPSDSKLIMRIESIRLSLCYVDKQREKCALFLFVGCSVGGNENRNQQHLQEP